MNVLRYKDDLGRVFIVSPSPDFVGSIDELAMIVVPDGVDFEILDASEIVQIEEIEIEFPDLTPKRFEWLLAYTGLGDVWDAVEAALKNTDRESYAMVKSERRAASYRIAVTLALVGQLRPIAAQVAPGVDLSDDAIKTAWKLAVKG